MNPDFSKSFSLVRKRVKAKNALLVVGLPGIGFVSKMAVDNLVKKLKAEKIATIYSPHFPNQILSMPSGKLKPFSMKLYYKKIKKTDVFFLRGDLQPLTVEGQYEVSSTILSLAKELGVTELLAMAGFAVNGLKTQPVIYGAFTSKNLFASFKKLGVKQLKNVVPVVGMAGLLPSLAKLYGIHGACLLVETPGTPLDATGAKALIDLLGKKLGEKFDHKDLEKRVKKVEKLLMKMEQQQPMHSEEGHQLVQPEVSLPISKDVLSYIR